MNLRFPSRKTFVLTLAGLSIALVLFLWLILPRIIQDQAEKFIATRTAHHLIMNRPQFHPFELSLRLSGLSLAEPDGKPLLALRELVVDLSAASLYRRALVFDEIRLDGMAVSVAMLADKQLNWSGLIAALQGKEKTPDAAAPRFDIHHLILSDSHVDFADHRMQPAFITRIEPFNLELTDFSSLADDQGKYKFAARTSTGARLAWQGEVKLEPLVATGSFSVEEVNLATLTAYLQEMLPIAQPRGMAGLSANFRAAYTQGKPELSLEHMTAKLTGLHLEQPQGYAVKVDALEAQEGKFDLDKNRFMLGSLGIKGCGLSLQSDQAKQVLEIGSLGLQAVQLDLAERRVVLGSALLSDGHVRVARGANGHIDILDALKKATPSDQTKPASTSKEADWRYHLEKLELSGFDFVLRDESAVPAAELALKDITLGIENISDDWKAAVPVNASFNAQGGGRFEATGNVVPDAPAADFQLKLTDLDLKPVQPYLSSAVRLKLASGTLSTQGRMIYNALGSNYKGNFSLSNLLLNEADTGELFLAWKSLGSRTFEASPSKLDIGELAVTGLDTKLIINKDKTLSFKRILRQQNDTPNNQTVNSSKGGNSLLVNIDRLRFIRGEMDFADYSLALPFGTRIHDIKGVVSGLSTRADALGQLELDGQVDEYGLARAVGQIDLMNPTDMTDVKVVFRNIEMSRLTPYSATFAGRKITSGKLSLDLEYKIKQRQLQGKNQVVMDQLTLGEKVNSPDARDLPLDLAISILQDADGRIDLGLPVSGSLDDPKFSYGGIIWQAIANVLTRIATAPFRALGALFGGDEKFENIAFEAGNAQLTPPEREKLVHLATVLLKRPTLSLSVHGVYADTDRVALQDLQLRRLVALKSGQHLEAEDDPGPLSTRQPKVQSALETLFSDSLGGGELAALKDGFRKANPGSLSESTSGKVLAGLTGLFREKRILSAQEVAVLKGADFYAVLFERLRSGVAVEDKQLLNLASARAEATVAVMKEAGIPMARLAVLATEKIQAEGRDVPVKLVLGTL